MAYEIDGQSVMDIGSTAQTALGRWLHYYDNTPKRLPNGRRFYMFAGYYYYLITQGDNQRFLRAEYKKDLEVGKRFDWTNVPGLTGRLEWLLWTIIKSSSIHTAMVKNSHLKIVWYEPDRELRQNEQRWLRVVQTVVNRIRNE